MFIWGFIISLFLAYTFRNTYFDSFRVVMHVHALINLGSHSLITYSASTLCITNLELSHLLTYCEMFNENSSQMQICSFPKFSIDIIVCDESAILSLKWPSELLDSKVHGANMGPTWVLSAPDGPHVGLMNHAIREELVYSSGGRGI